MSGVTVPAVLLDPGIRTMTAGFAFEVDAVLLLRGLLLGCAILLCGIGYVIADSGQIDHSFGHFLAGIGIGIAGVLGAGVWVWIGIGVAGLGGIVLLRSSITTVRRRGRIA